MVYYSRILPWLILAVVVFSRIEAAVAAFPTLPASETVIVPKPSPTIATISSREMTGEELIKAEATTDDQGARWKVELPEMHRNEDLSAPPKAFWLSNSGILTSFDHCLLLRRFSDGRFGQSPRTYDGVVDQISMDPRETVSAFTFNRESQPEFSDTEIVLVKAGEHVPKILRAHKAKPWRIVFSPDATRLVSCADDELFCLWNANTGEEIKQFPGYAPGGNANARRGEFVAFSPDDKWLATVFGDAVTIRRAKDGEEAIIWRPGQGGWQPNVIRFSPDGRSLFAFTDTSGLTNRALRFVQYRFGPPAVIEGERRFEGNHVASDGTVTPDGKYVITWYLRSPRAIVWDIEQRKEVAVIRAARNAIFDVTLSPKGDVVATVGDNSEVKFWSVGKWKELPTKQKYQHDGCSLVRFSTDGKYVVTCSDGWLRVWDAPEFCFVNSSRPSQRYD